MDKVRWGVLSTAKIGVNNVIPSMQKSDICDIVAISSRSEEKAKEAAYKLEIPKAYGSYEELMEDPDIDAIYNPLPNHLHVPMTIQAMKAGKHVLCEKPISITATEAEILLNETKKYPHLKVMEAFMYRFHPQWDKVKEIIRKGNIGEVRTMNSVFTYFNNDPDNVRNKADIGGGGILDIGCYCINLSRMIFDDEPVSVKSSIDIDPDFKTDRLASGILEFKNGVANFMCSTQLEHHQVATIYGTKGYLQLNIPFNAANEQTRKLHFHSGGKTDTILFDTVDQYTLQGDAFSEAVLADKPVPISLVDSLANMKVIDQLFKYK